MLLQSTSNLIGYRLNVTLIFYIHHSQNIRAEHITYCSLSVYRLIYMSLIYLLLTFIDRVFRHYLG